MEFARTNRKVAILVILLFLCAFIRVSIIIWENNNLAIKFTVNPDEPYQRKIQVSEPGFIDDYIYRLYSPFAEAPIGMPNTFMLKDPISYYSIPDDSLKPVITLDAGKIYMSRIYDTNNYKYGIQSWPTYKKGWRYVIPFFEEGNLKSDVLAYYVKLTDLYSPLKSIIKERNNTISKGYDNRMILLHTDELLYEEGYYMSPDLQKPVVDGWNIVLFVGSFYLIIIQITFRLKADR